MSGVQASDPLHTGPLPLMRHSPVTQSSCIMSFPTHKQSLGVFGGYIIFHIERIAKLSYLSTNLVGIRSVALDIR